MAEFNHETAPVDPNATDYVKQWLQYADNKSEEETSDIKADRLAELYFNASKLRIFGEFLTNFSNSIIGDIDMDMRRDFANNTQVQAPVDAAQIISPLFMAVNNKDKLLEIAKTINETTEIVYNILRKVKV